MSGRISDISWKAVLSMFDYEENPEIKRKIYRQDTKA